MMSGQAAKCRLCSPPGIPRDYASNRQGDSDDVRVIDDQTYTWRA
jgi:hypothetical protein